MNRPIETSAGQLTTRGQAARRRPFLGWASAGAAAVLAVALVLPAPGVSAQGSGHGRPCSDVMLRGDYGFLVSGVRRVPFGPYAGQNEMIVASGIRTFDGLGGFIDRTAGLHGQLTGVTGAGGEVPGTYSVNTDCTGTSVFSPPNAPPIVGAFVIVDNGRQIKEAIMQPTPNVVTVVLDRN